ncbi:MAG TPA: acyl-CoA dehydrogenase family protein [Thermoanaerobaculia bacterium]|nr:acyl-CoA dehydrogenase family protein [Thermoanaerobaculia bacterium]
MSPGFLQSPPALGNQYHDDRVLRSLLARLLPAEMLAEIEPELAAMGELAGGELYDLQLADRENEPRLTRWSPWGERIDRVEVTPLWRRAERIAAERGLVAIPYEARHGRFSRLHQMALVHLFHPSTDVYTCPLAMTDGAARTLLAHGAGELAERAVPHLTSRDPAAFWTSGQWMTETAGGSDVGRSETVARRGEDGRWRLHGRKWFTSAAASQIALTLARPEGNPPGGRGLALFYLETRDADGALNGLTLERLKDKLGTRKLPTAEITLDGTLAEPVAGTADGVRAMVPMLVLTRTWNAVSAASFMRRGVALARDYARRRVAFGAPLSEKPLHRDTLAGLEAEAEGAFHLTFRLVELVGRPEAGELDEQGERLLRVLTPVVKATTARQAVAVASEAIEAFGGAGYVEDTGLPVLLRDSQVLSIWEGTTNVLALDALRAFAAGGERDGVAAAVVAEVERAAEAGRGVAGLEEPAAAALAATRHALAWLAAAHRGDDGRRLEAGGRRFALTLGRALEAALLVEHARWTLDRQGDGRPAAAARRLAAAGLDLVTDPALADSRALATDEPPGAAAPA